MNYTSFLQRPILGLRPLVWLLALILLAVAVIIWRPLLAPQSGAEGSVEQVERTEVFV